MSNVEYFCDSCNFSANSLAPFITPVSRELDLYKCPKCGSRHDPLVEYDEDWRNQSEESVDDDENSNMID